MGSFRVSEEYVRRHPDADPSATELVINVLHAAELLGRRLDDVLRPFGLTRGSFNALQVLAGAEGPLMPKDVTARLTVTTATVTGLLDTLEARRLASRRPHPTDRRSVLVEVTEAGRRLLAELEPHLIEQEKVWVEGVPQPDRERLLRLLGRLQDHLR